MVGAGALDERVPDGTQVVSFDSVTSNILELNQSVTVSNADDLGFGFVGTTVVLDDITGIDIGEEVTGLGVPAGTTVVNTSNDDVALDPNTIILSAGVNVEDAVAFTFQCAGVLSAHRSCGAWRCNSPRNDFWCCLRRRAGYSDFHK